MSEARACTACGRLQSYPAPVCRGCGGTSFALCTLPLRAEIYSFTTVSRAPTPALQAETPYTAVLARLPRGGLLLLRWRGARLPTIGGPAQIQDEGGMLVAQEPE